MKIELSIKKDLLAPILLIGLLLLIFTFRNYDVGTDTIKYVQNYIDYTSYETPNILFKGLVYFLHIFSNNPNFFLFSLGSLILVPFFISYKKLSPIPLLSIILFAGFFYGFSLNIARQFIVMSFFYLFGLNFIIKRQLIRFLLLIIMLSMIHIVSIVYLPFYIFIQKKLDIRYYITILLLSILLFSIGINSWYFSFFEILGRNIRIFFPQMPSYLLNPGNLIINSISINRLILYNLLFLPVLFFYKKIKDYPFGVILFNLFFWGIIMQNLFYHFIPFLRVPMCFFIALTYLYPIIIYNIKYKYVYALLITVLSLGVFFIMFVLGGQAGLF